MQLITSAKQSSQHASGANKPARECPGDGGNIEVTNVIYIFDVSNQESSK